MGVGLVHIAVSSIARLSHVEALTPQQISPVGSGWFGRGCLGGKDIGGGSSILEEGRRLGGAFVDDEDVDIGVSRSGGNLSEGDSKF